LPYKDLEQRRRYDREYKRRLRARTGLTKLGRTRGRKAYLCPRFPGLRIQGLAFRDGWFITANPGNKPSLSRTRPMANRSSAGGWSSKGRFHLV
jgi:hypothetical protein